MPRSGFLGITNCRTGSETLYWYSGELQPSSYRDIFLDPPEISVLVKDRDTREPLEGAEVATRGVESLTEASGVALLSNLQSEEPVEICASRPPAYDSECKEGIEWPPERDLEFLLSRREEERKFTEGSVNSAEPIVHGRIFAVDPVQGTVASSLIAPDGQFRLPLLKQGDYLIIASQSHPLTVMFPDPASGPLRIEIPFLGGTSVQVIDSAAGEDAFRPVTVRVDGAIVPVSVFGYHQSMRGQQVAVMGRGPLQIHGVSGRSIELIAGPSERD